MASTFQVSDWTGGTYQDRRYMSECLSFRFPFVVALWCLGVNWSGGEAFWLNLPCEQRFLFSMAFSMYMYKGIFFACHSHSWFVYTLRETSAGSCLWFPLCIHFRHLQILEGVSQVLKLDLTSFSRKWFKRLLRTVPTIVTAHIFCASQGQLHAKRKECTTRGTGLKLCHTWKSRRF